MDALGKLVDVEWENGTFRGNVLGVYAPDHGEIKQYLILYKDGQVEEEDRDVVRFVQGGPIHTNTVMNARKEISVTEDKKYDKKYGIDIEVAQDVVPKRKRRDEDDVNVGAANKRTCGEHDSDFAYNLLFRAFAWRDGKGNISEYERLARAEANKLGDRSSCFDYDDQVHRALLKVHTNIINSSFDADDADDASAVEALVQLK